MITLKGNVKALITLPNGYPLAYRMKREISESDFESFMKNKLFKLAVDEGHIKVIKPPMPVKAKKDK